jgi:hypothetical protein
LLSYSGAAPVEKFAIQVGDQAMGGNIARATLTTHAGVPIDGTGIKVGILSVSFNEQPTSATAGADYDAFNGYLPFDQATFGSAVTVIKEGSPGSDDEGRAMAELVHQVAPGAQIFFYAPTTLTDFAAGIDAMVQDGVNIIVDDLSNTEEPFFQVAGRCRRQLFHLSGQLRQCLLRGCLQTEDDDTSRCDRVRFGAGLFQRHDAADDHDNAAKHHRAAMGRAVFNCRWDAAGVVDGALPERQSDQIRHPGRGPGQRLCQ